MYDTHVQYSIICLYKWKKRQVTITIDGNIAACSIKLQNKWNVIPSGGLTQAHTKGCITTTAPQAVKKCAAPKKAIVIKHVKSKVAAKKCPW